MGRTMFLSTLMILFDKRPKLTSYMSRAKSKSNYEIRVSPEKINEGLLYFYKNKVPDSYAWHNPATRYQPLH